MTLQRSFSGGVATLALDRPQARNALDMAMCEALLAACRELAARDDVRLVLVRAVVMNPFWAEPSVRARLLPELVAELRGLIEGELHGRRTCPEPTRGLQPAAAARRA